MLSFEGDIYVGVSAIIDKLKVRRPRLPICVSR